MLILGSMPGTASLDAARYYAHPRNAFWPIALALVAGEAPTADGLPPYEVRVTRLVDGGVALWDVLAECERAGSLDSAIRRDSERANDVAALVDRHPELELVAFNGQTAAKLFERHVAAEIRARRPTLRFATLPSTSPAHASLSLVEKHARWCAALEPVLGRGVGRRRKKSDRTAR